MASGRHRDGHAHVRGSLRGGTELAGFAMKHRLKVEAAMGRNVHMRSN